MSTTVFFNAERSKFFRPLSSSRRELISACVRVMYERLHGPAADYSHNLNRESLKELLLPVIREHQNDSFQESTELDEFNSVEAADPQELASLVIRALVRDGWLEQFADRQGLVKAFRFSRPGKLFAESFYALFRHGRSRQRNMRSCRNALAAAAKPGGSGDDILDAHEFAEKVIDDLGEGIDYLQERIRQLMQEASVHTQWDDFVEFLERFRRDYSKQLVADGATLNRNAIRKNLEELRMGTTTDKFNSMEGHIRDTAHWAVAEYSGPSVFEWLLGRIEDIVNTACEVKQPSFMKAMDTYISRITGLVQQSMMLRTGESRHAYLGVMGKLASKDTPGQDRLLNAIGNQFSLVELKLLDPGSFKLRDSVKRNKAATVSVRPHASREARLLAAVNGAVAQAFSVSSSEVERQIRKDLLLYRHPIRLSTLPIGMAKDLLSNLQVVEAVRGAPTKDLQAKRLDIRLDNDFYTGYDYEIDFKKKP